MRAPEFWYADMKEKGGSLWPRILTPLGKAYDWAGRIRAWRTTPHRAGVPVICIGNLTAGGTGKTPLTLALARELRATGEKPFVLTRGYGGSAKGPLLANPGNHSAREIGDEPLMLSKSVSTIISRDRIAGADFAVARGATLILMDDGFQNPTLAKDFSILVVDGEAGFGNGKVIPAGPLREPVDRGLARADAIVIMGHAIAARDADRLALTRARAPVFTALLQPQPTEEVMRQRVLAFAGIGRPEKFFDTATRVGYRVVATKSFADHHAYTEKEIETLRDEARRLEATLLTTEKDMVRLDINLRRDIRVLPVEVEVNDMTGLMDRLRRAIQSFRAQKKENRL